MRTPPSQTAIVCSRFMPIALPRLPGRTRPRGRAAAPANPRHSRPPFLQRLRLQLVFEVVEEAPIGVFGEDLVWCRFDQTRLVKAQGIKPNRILGVVVPPFVVRQFAQGLTFII